MSKCGIYLLHLMNNLKYFNPFRLWLLLRTIVSLRRHDSWSAKNPRFLFRSSVNTPSSTREFFALKWWSVRFHLKNNLFSVNTEKKKKKLFPLKMLKNWKQTIEWGNEKLTEIHCLLSSSNKMKCNFQIINFWVIICKQWRNDWRR